jgi:hypothetical protein
VSQSTSVLTVYEIYMSVQGDFEQAAVLLASAYHARSFHERSWSRSVVRVIGPRQRETRRSDNPSKDGSCRFNHFGGDFFTGK